MNVWGLNHEKISYKDMPSTSNIVRVRIKLMSDVKDVAIIVVELIVILENEETF
jgi:hypothetical protein